MVGWLLGQPWWGDGPPAPAPLRPPHKRWAIVSFDWWWWWWFGRNCSSCLKLCGMIAAAAVAPTMAHAMVALRV